MDAYLKESLTLALEEATDLHTDERNNIKWMTEMDGIMWSDHLKKMKVDKPYIKNLMFKMLMAKNLLSCRVDLAQKNLQMIKDTRDEFGAMIFNHAHLLSDKEYQYFLDKVMVNYNDCKDLYTLFKDLHEKGLRWGQKIEMLF